MVECRCAIYEQMKEDKVTYFTVLNLKIDPNHTIHTSFFAETMDEAIIRLQQKYFEQIQK